jgi:hypothetical protein
MSARGHAPASCSAAHFVVLGVIGGRYPLAMIDPDSDHATPGEASTDASEAPAPTCPWCAARTAADATRCASCGAALAQRDDIGGLIIPGLTSVDPALQDYDKRPLTLHGPSPSQGMASGLMAGAMAGGPLGIAAIGGVAAVAAVEYLGAGRGGPGGADLESVGKPSEVVLQALDRLGDEPAAPELPGNATDGEEAEGGPGGQPLPDPENDGRSIWRDLPRPDDSDPERNEEGIHG